MSFTSQVKEELGRVELSCPGCGKAELSALIRIEGTLSLSGGNRIRLEVSTETAGVARAVIRLLHGLYHLETELTVRRSVLHKTHNYLIAVPHQQALIDALRDLGVLGAAGFEQGIAPSLVKRECCAAAYLRGIFLSCGYIADPRGDFHFELSAASEELADGIVELMAAHGIRARWIRRHNTCTIYMKGVEQIIAFLAFTGAHNSVLAVESARVIKSMRNDTNRRVNAEMANQQKAARASAAQIDRIRKLVETRGIDDIPKSLQEVVMLRLRHPDASIKELGEMANPPLSKSAVYHRIRRINELAGE